MKCVVCGRELTAETSARYSVTVRSQVLDACSLEHQRKILAAPDDFLNLEDSCC